MPLGSCTTTAPERLLDLDGGCESRFALTLGAATSASSLASSLTRASRGPCKMVARVDEGDGVFGIRLSAEGPTGGPRGRGDTAETGRGETREWGGGVGDGAIRVVCFIAARL